MTARFGLLRGDINEEYSALGKAIGCLNHSFVGVFYPVHDQTTVIMFRTFDASCISYFGNYISVERLSQSDLITNLEISYFKEEEWRVEGRGESLRERFSRTVNNFLLENDAVDYKSLLKRSVDFGATNGVKNGYRVVNEIATESLGLAMPQSDDGYKTLYESRFLQPWIQMNGSVKERVFVERFELEVRNSLDLLFRNFCELILEDKFYAESIYNLAANRNVRQNKSTKSQSQNYTVAIDAAEEMRYIRQVIQDVTEGFQTGKIPVIQVSDLIDSYNSLATKLSEPSIDKSTLQSKYRSMGVLAQSSSKNFESDEIDVKLNCGTTIVLPAKCGSFDDFNEDQLIQILRYIRSLDVIDGRFNYMTEQIVRELAVRVNQ